MFDFEWDKPFPCFHIKIKAKGDESIDLCDIMDRVCLLVSDAPCNIYHDHLEEVKNESSFG